MASSDGPWRLQDVDSVSDHERELYERAHEAAKEAQRQGDAQLQAAVAAAAGSTVYYPVSTPVRFNAWSLRFEDKRLESVYWRKCSTDSNFSDLGPTTCELAVCVLRLWMLGGSEKRQALVFLAHVCAAACTMMIISLQVLFSKWYQQNRGLLLWHFAIVLWCWEGLQLYFAGHNSLLHMVLLILPQCILISFLYRVPFCLQMRSRGIGFGCQLIATLTGDVSQAASLYLVGILIAHTLGSLMGYIVDRQARLNFIESLPRWLLDDASQCERGGTPSQWNSFYPELLEKPEAVKDFVGKERALAHRALGGFAGGFGGVSGLKCANASSPAPASSSSNSLGGGQQQQELVSDSSETGTGSELPDAWSVGNASQGPEQVQDSISSASSQVRNSNLSIRRRF